MKYIFLKKNILRFFILFLFYSGTAQNKYSVDIIPDSLKKHADAVIRYEQTDVILNGGNIVYKIKRTVTVINKRGERFAYIIVPYDKLRKFVSLKAKYYDKNGNIIKTLKKKDIKDISYYEGLYSDNRLKYVEPLEFLPPYTVEYEIETKSSGLPDIIDWYPVFGYYMSSEKSVLNVFSSGDYKYRTKEYNFKGRYIDGQNKRTWIIENIKAVISEPYNYSVKNLISHIHIAPSDFSVEGFEGNMDTWQNFGKWVMLLNKGRDKLPEETEEKIKKLVKNINNDREKAKAVYEYMQNKTRYVSIQLGIGGWQPFEAAYTDRNGYGDCKALSYYTQSLLKVAGIKSYYTIINAGKDASRIDTEFPSLQFNHAILCVPLENDTVWLECTNQKIPFGYISNFTDDRYALAITEDGGRLVHTVAYSEEQNTQIRKANIKLFLNGDIDVDIHTEYNGLQYDNVSSLFDLPDDEKEKKLKNLIPIPGLSDLRFSYNYKKDEIPSATEDLNFKVKSYASSSSGRLFFKPDLLDRKENIPKILEKRKSYIDLRSAYTDIDTLVYELPDNTVPEYISPNSEIISKFGNYSVKSEIKNGKLIYIREIVMHKGIFPPSDYDDLREFFKSIAASDNRTYVLKIIN